MDDRWRPMARLMVEFHAIDSAKWRAAHDRLAQRRAHRGVYAHALYQALDNADRVCAVYRGSKGALEDWWQQDWPALLPWVIGRPEHAFLQAATMPTARLVSHRVHEPELASAPDQAQARSVVSLTDRSGA